MVSPQQLAVEQGWRRLACAVLLSAFREARRGGEDAAEAAAFLACEGVGDLLEALGFERAWRADLVGGKVLATGATAAEAAAATGYNEKHIWTLVVKGRVEGTRTPDGGCLVNLQSLSEYIARCDL